VYGGGTNVKSVAEQAADARFQAAFGLPESQAKDETEGEVVVTAPSPAMSLSSTQVGVRFCCEGPAPVAHYSPEGLRALLADVKNALGGVGAQQPADDVTDDVIKFYTLAYIRSRALAANNGPGRGATPKRQKPSLLLTAGDVEGEWCPGNSAAADTKPRGGGQRGGRGA
jgi:hypothetical protein